MKTPTLTMRQLAHISRSIPPAKSACRTGGPRQSITPPAPTRRRQQCGGGLAAPKRSAGGPAPSYRSDWSYLSDSASIPQSEFRIPHSAAPEPLWLTLLGGLSLWAIFLLAWVIF